MERKRQAEEAGQWGRGDAGEAGEQGKRAQKVLVLMFGSRVSGGTVINKSASRGNRALTT